MIKIGLLSVHSLALCILNFVTDPPPPLLRALHDAKAFRQTLQQMLTICMITVDTQRQAMVCPKIDEIFFTLMF